VSSCFSPLDRLCLTPRPGAEPRSPHNLGPIAPLLNPPTFPQPARYLNTGFNTARFPPAPRPAALPLPMPPTLHGSPPLYGAPRDRYGPRVLWGREGYTAHARAAGLGASAESPENRAFPQCRMVVCPLYPDPPIFENGLIPPIVWRKIFRNWIGPWYGLGNGGAR